MRETVPAPLRSPGGNHEVSPKAKSYAWVLE
jgi:hypothetical protein